MFAGYAFARYAFVPGAALWYDFKDKKKMMDCGGK
jgi:hypothetical protein